MTETETHARKTTAAKGLRMLLAHIVDYAGTFPPAALTLEEAARRYASYRTSEESWMLGSFVCAARDLKDLLPLVGSFDITSPLELSVVFSGGGSTAEYLQNLQKDLQAISEFSAGSSIPVAVRQLEGRLPQDLLDTDVITVRKFLDEMDVLLEHAEMQDADLFFEVPVDERRHQIIPVVNGAVSAFNRQRSNSLQGSAGLKVRLGGEVVPASDQLAYLITTCRDASVRFKATAGLHHPLYRYDDSTETEQHGFLNVFVASVLATADALETEAVAQILADGDPDHFTFSSDGVDWMTFRAPLQDIERTRRERACSFGSCSFEEPIEDLHHLGLL